MKALHRASLVLAFTALPLLACGPQFAVIPQHGVQHASSSTSGVLLTAFADQWAGQPEDLANTVTPIAVDIYNGTQSEVRVSLSDFALFTDQGVRLPAINVFETPVAALETNPASDGRAALTLSPGVLVAGPIEGPAGSIFTREAHGGGGGGGGHGGGGGGHFGGGAHYSGGGHYGGGPGYNAHYTVGTRARYVGGRRAAWAGSWGGGPRWGLGFRPYGGLRWWYGDGLYWGGPWAYGPAYDMWVTGWGANYGYQPSPDVVEYALPEGVLAPGAHINGFLYFQRATATGARSVTLTWAPHDVHTDVAVGEDKIVLDIVKL